MAVTVRLPLLRVWISTDARPLGSVKTVKVLAPVMKRPGPFGGSDRSTPAFSMGLPKTSVTPTNASKLSPESIDVSVIDSETSRAASRAVTTGKTAVVEFRPSTYTLTDPTVVEKR